MTAKNLKMILITSLFILAAGLLIWTNRSYTVTRSTFAMGTLIEITVTGKEPQKAADDAFKTIKHIEKLTNYVSTSDLQKLNHFAGIHSVRLSNETMELLKIISEHYHKVSGAFDPTIAPLVNLWGFGTSGEPQLPPKGRIAKLIKLINFEDVQINFRKKTAFLTKSGMRIDFGGLAKGYAIDQAYQTLLKHNIKSALINGGSSSIRVIGKKNPTSPWRLGIGHPRRPGQLLGALTLPGNRALGTSADTQNFFIHQGTRYSHLIDPQTGYPARDKVLITVTAPTAGEADLLSTAFFILPLSKIKAYVKVHPEIGVVLYDSNQNLTVINEPNFSKNN